MVQNATASALKFLNISEEVYVNSFKALLPTPEGQRLSSQIEMETYEKLEPHAPLDKKSEDYLKTYCEKLQMEAQCEIQIV